jgi:hypothetical protein
MIRRHWNGVAAHRTPGSKVLLGFVEGANSKVSVFERHAHGVRDGVQLCLKVVSGRFRCWLRRNHRHNSRMLHNFWDVRTNSRPLVVLYRIIHLEPQHARASHLGKYQPSQEKHWGGPVIGSPSAAGTVIRDLSYSDPMAKWLRRSHSLVREGPIRH